MIGYARAPVLRIPCHGAILAAVVIGPAAQIAAVVVGIRPVADVGWLMRCSDEVVVYLIVRRLVLRYPHQRVVEHRVGLALLDNITEIVVDQIIGVLPALAGREVVVPCGFNQPIEVVVDKHLLARAAHQIRHRRRSGIVGGQHVADKIVGVGDVLHPPPRSVNDLASQAPGRWIVAGLRGDAVTGFQEPAREEFVVFLPIDIRVSGTGLVAHHRGGESARVVPVRDNLPIWIGQRLRSTPRVELRRCRPGQPFFRAVVEVMHEHGGGLLNNFAQPVERPRLGSGAVFDMHDASRSVVGSTRATVFIAHVRRAVRVRDPDQPVEIVSVADLTAGSAQVRRYLGDHLGGEVVHELDPAAIRRRGGGAATQQVVLVRGRVPARIHHLD